MEFLTILKDSLEKEFCSYIDESGHMKLNCYKTIISLKIAIEDTNISFGSEINNPINNLFLKLLKEKNFTNVNQVFEFIEGIREISSNLTKYCVACHKKLDFQSQNFVTCGEDNCNYMFEEFMIGDIVLEKVKEDKEIVEFLIESAKDAITSERKMDIFEPFPKYFMKGHVDTIRGQVSKLAGKDYDYLKDFARLENVMAKLDIKKFFEQCDMSLDDLELTKMIGEDCYRLIRFIILSCRMELRKDSKILDIECPGITIYKVIHSFDKEEDFAKLAANSPKLYLFHGSKWQNWYSILRNGLKNCSNTKLMTAGAAYGNGIYLSDNLAISYGYGNSATYSVVGVFQLAKDKEKYFKGGNVYVVDNESVLLQRYLLMIPHANYTVNNITNTMNSIFSNKIHQEENKMAKTVFSKGLRKLVNEYKALTKQDPEILGFRTELDPKNTYLWHIFITKYDDKYPVGQDMKDLGIKEIELEIKFPENYPFSPPFIRVIKPRFKRVTGHVISGALCLQVLNEKFWSPASSIESLIITIKSEILEGEGRIDPQNYNIPYQESEARASFIAVSKAHGWT